MDVDSLRGKSMQYRRDVLQYITRSGAGHTGGSLSSVDILNVLYNSVLRISPANWNSLDRDFFVQSKGHSVEALYAVLTDRGFIPREEFDRGFSFGSRLIGHPTRKVPGVEQNTGGLGHGLSFSVGLALAARFDRRDSRIACLLGDGELGEGSVWEAAMAAGHYGLDNLVAIVDRNGLQITGATEEVIDLEPLADKWTAFGWSTEAVDGNDVAALSNAFSRLPFTAGKPSVLLARTVKGKGVSFMENRPEWHHHVPTEEELTTALAELESERETER